MSKVADYITENARYLREAVAVIEGLTDGQLNALIQANEDLNGGIEPGIDSELVSTTETLDDFDASRINHWNERGNRVECVFEGLNAVKFERVQMNKGHPREDFTVVDMGDRRVVVK